MNRKRLSLAAPLVALTVACAPTTVYKIPQATSGSKSDGTVRLAYEAAANEDVRVDWQEGEKNAAKRCRAWGYSRVDPFSGVLSQCVERGQGLLVNGALPGACAREMVYKDYQCLD